jgi:hypothetical protein
MSSIANYNVVTTNIGAIAGTATLPMWPNPTSNGKITISDTDTFVTLAAAGTATLSLIYFDVTGATVQGTIGAFGSASNVFTAGLPVVLTLTSATTAIVPAGKFLGIKSGAGTGGNTVTIVSVAWNKGV